MIYDIYDRMMGRLFKVFKNEENIQKLYRVRAVALQDTLDALEYIISQRGIDDSEGTKLDKIGTVLGVPRPLAQVPPDELFTLFDQTETGDLNLSQGFSDEDDPIVGGYFADEKGLDDGTGLGMVDAKYRVLLNQKANSYRKKLTHENAYNYMLVFGSRCLLNESDLTLEIEPANDADLTHWERYYIENKGFKPAGINVYIQDYINGAQPL